MKFVHIADIHFDKPFTRLETRGLSETRRLEQTNAFKKVIEYIKQNEIPYLFICGDLFEAEYVKQSTIDYINKKFEEIPNTKIYITPGNHDPYTKNSYYNTYPFAQNVKIFTSKIEKIEEPNLNIYGYGFEDYYMKNKNTEELKVEDKTKINILLTHADLDGAEKGEIKYNPVPKSELKTLGFDYIALGHVHKRQAEDEITYPGSLISLGFDELGEHGMLVRRNRRANQKTNTTIYKNRRKSIYRNKPRYNRINIKRRNNRKNKRTRSARKHIRKNKSNRK